MKKVILSVCLFAISFIHNIASAQPDLPNEHAPIGVMGDHTHGKGGWMLSYRFMRMTMEDNLQGSNEISPDQIVTLVANRFANPPMMPPTLRVVPLEMTTEMHMFGLMHAPTEKITLMAMLNLIDREMDHVTYMGPAGTTELGRFKTETSGLGDIKLGLLYSLAKNADYNLHLNFALSLRGLCWYIC